MEKNKKKMPLPKITVDDLFSTQEERDDAAREKVIEINLDEIDNFPNHPFKVIENEDMKDLIDSIKENGVLVPAVVREKNGRYELISGHRRKYASEIANKSKIPCIVRNMTDDEATIIMVDTNLQREKILPSEKAFAYKMRLDAIRRVAGRPKKNKAQVVPNLNNKPSREILSEEVGESREKIRKFIRLTNLIKPILEMVDEEKIALAPAVQLSYLTEEEQNILLDFMEMYQATPSVSQSIKLRELSENGKLDADEIADIMEQEKPNQRKKLNLNESRLRSVLPKNIEEKKIEDFVIKSIEYYSKHLRQKEIER